MGGQARAVGKTAKRGDPRKDGICLSGSQLLFAGEWAKLVPECHHRQEDCCTTVLGVDQLMAPGRDRGRHEQLQQLQS
jgi:hypothetical protein